ncbi:MAG: aminoglycoside phosphotransferase family protein, partial [Planctomycetes bacterium]|nr:aminoglycoside phosphotransferase family protein [Planctomycetota bacterium]
MPALVDIRNDSIEAGALPLAERLRRARDVDGWVLLGGPRFDRVACLGSVRDERLAALREAAFPGAVVDAGDEFQGRYDVVLAHNPDAGELLRLAGLLNPGGSVWIDVDRRARASHAARPADVRAIVETLQRLGFEDVAVWWQRPDFQAARELIPLDDRPLLKRALIRSGGWRTRVKSLFARLALATGCLDAAARCQTITARRATDGPDPAPRERHPADAIAALLDAEREAIGAAVPEFEPAGAQCVFKTPRFPASRHIIGLVYERHGKQPVLVAKLPRLPDAADGLLREAAALEAIHAGRADAFPGVPRPVLLCEWNGRPILVETALLGTPISPAVVRARRDRVCRAVVEWLLRAVRDESREGGGQTPLRTSDTEPGKAYEPQRGLTPYARLERLIGRPLRLIEERLALDADDRRRIARARCVLEPLLDARLPAVFEHGDMSHPNLLRVPGGDAGRAGHWHLGVLDWELAEPEGLPACDLMFFLAYASDALARARTLERQRAAFRQTFFGGSAWMRRWVGEYVKRLQLPAAVLPALFVACWTRSLAELV